MKLSKKNDNKYEAFDAELLKDVPRYRLKQGHKLKLIVNGFSDKSGYQVFTEHHKECFHISGSEEKILETIKFLEPTTQSN